MADNITLTVNNPYPTRSGSAATASGGSFAAATYSFLAVAWYRSAETDNDFAGWSLSVADDWDGVAVSANQKVTLTINKPAKTIGGNSVQAYYDHLAVYIQTAASFDLSSTAAKCTAITFTDVSATQTSAVITAETSTGSVTFGTSYTSKSTADGQIEWRGVPRENTVITAGGSSNKRSHAADLTFGGLEIEGFPQLFSGTMSSWHFLMKCQKHGLPLKITDASSTKWLSDYYGTIHGLTYPGSTGKNRDRFNFGFRIESEDEA